MRNNLTPREVNRVTGGHGGCPALFPVLQTATLPLGNWPDGHRPLVDARGNVVGIVAAKVLAHEYRVAAGECELRGEELLALELPGIAAKGGSQIESAKQPI